MKKHVLAVGYYGFGNAGDEAVLTGLRHLLQDAQIVAASNDPEWTTAEHGIASVPLSGADGIAAAASSDLVIIGGGGLLNDVIPFEPNLVFSSKASGIAAYMSLAMASALSGVPYVIWAMGVGPIEHPTARKAVRELVEHASDVVVRDVDSADVVESLGLQSPSVAGDLATVVDAQVLPLSRDAADIAFAVMPWERPLEEDAERLRQLLLSLPKEIDVALIPVKVRRDGGPDDATLARLAAEGTTARVVEGTWAERLGVARGARATVAMRYHALFAAALGDRPFIAVAYEPKIASLARSLGRADSIVSLADLDASLAPRIVSLLDEPVPDSSRRVRELQSAVRARLRWPEPEPERVEAARRWAGRCLIETRDGVYAA